MLERIVHDQIFDFLLENNVITKNQSAFRKLCSTITSLICSTHHWHENIDNKKLNLTIFLDLKKAFDTVDHKILAEKIAQILYEGHRWELVSVLSISEDAILCRRRTINGNGANMWYTTRFLLRTSPIYHILDDFESCWKFSQASIYADDTNVTITSDDIEIEAQQELLNLAEWMRINKLSPNPAKTEYMIIGHSRKVNTVNISNALMLNDSVIKRVTRTKSLGVTVYENLKWDEHFNTVKGKYVVDLHR